jgi:hypothetical protein
MVRKGRLALQAYKQHFPHDPRHKRLARDLTLSLAFCYGGPRFILPSFFRVRFSLPPAGAGNDDRLLAKALGVFESFAPANAEEAATAEAKATRARALRGLTQCALLTTPPNTAQVQPPPPLFLLFLTFSFVFVF